MYDLPKFSFRLISYSTLGGVLFSLDLLLFYILVELFDFHIYATNSILYFISLHLNFFGCERFIFRANFSCGWVSRLLYSYMVGLVTIVVANLSLFIFISIYDVDTIVSKILSVALVFIWNFGARHFFVYSRF